MADIKKQIIDWFNGPQDYDTGVILLEQVSRKNKVLSKLIRRGENRSSFEKLVWELNKVAGLKKIPEHKPADPRKMPVTKRVITVKSGQESDQADADPKLKFNLIKDKPLESYPPEVQRLVNEYSSLYMQRGKKHSALKKLGDGNDDETVAGRKKVIEEIKPISNRLEVLYESFHDFEEKGEPVDSAMLWPDPAAKTENVQTKSIGELKTLKKNIQSSITKDKNMLLYSSKTKPANGKEKPYPAGPKRITLEKRIAKKEKEILDLDYRIAELG
jgi:hypothetical protein